jgi:hypothetical protein
MHRVSSNIEELDLDFLWGHFNGYAEQSYAFKFLPICPNVTKLTLKLDDYDIEAEGFGPKFPSVRSLTVYSCGRLTTLQHLGDSWNEIEEFGILGFRGASSRLRKFLIGQPRLRCVRLQDREYGVLIPWLTTPGVAEKLRALELGFAPNDEEMSQGLAICANLESLTFKLDAKYDAALPVLSK